MSGFLTGVVAIVDSEGNRVDTPNVDGDYVPVELQLGETLTATKSTNGSLTRVKVEAVGSGAATNAVRIGLSIVDCLSRNTNANSSVFTGTVGTMFAIMPGPAGTDPVIITGIRIYWAEHEPYPIKLSLWHNDDGLLASAETAPITGDGVYTAMFSSPYEVPDEYLGQKLLVSAHDTGPHKAVSAVNSPSARDWLPYLDNEEADQENVMPFINGNRFVWLNLNLYTDGDAQPATPGITDLYMIEPIFG